MGLKSACFVLAAFLILGPSIGSASPSQVSTEINDFVAKIYPKGSHYFWIINDSKTEAEHELIVDVNTAIQDRFGEAQGHGRFLLLLVDGKLFAAQRIPLGATVDCKNEEQV